MTGRLRKFHELIRRATALLLCVSLTCTALADAGAANYVPGAEGAEAAAGAAASPRWLSTFSGLSRWLNTAPGAELLSRRPELARALAPLLSPGPTAGLDSAALESLSRSLPSDAPDVIARLESAAAATRDPGERARLRSSLDEAYGALATAIPELSQTPRDTRDASKEAALAASAAGATIERIRARLARPESLDAADAADAQVFLTRADHPPVAVALSSLDRYLSENPALRESLNNSGRVRLVLAKDATAEGLGKADVPRIEAALRGSGVRAKLDVEHFAKPVPAKTDSSEAEEPPLRRMLKTSFTLPTPRTALTGLIVKFIIPFVVLRQTGWMADYAGHPVALSLVLGMNLSLNAFHGVFVNTWANFQNALAKQKGLNYQTTFNLIYGQTWGVLSRLITWGAGVRVNGTVPAPPWSLAYWRAVWISALVGSFFGTLGFQGVNILYNNGRLKQGQRDLLLLARDLSLILAGFFFGSGSMLVFWSMFSVQQAADFGIYTLSQKLRRHPVLYVADAAVASAPEFRKLYPVDPAAAPEASPLRQAWRLRGNPLVSSAAAVLKKAREVLGGRASSSRSAP